MHKNETNAENEMTATTAISQATMAGDENEKSSINDQESVQETTKQSQITPRPVFMRLLLLFGSAIGCLFVGTVVSMATGDRALLVMPAILSVALVAKGFLLRRKIKKGQIYSVSGVCVSIAPKMFRRYRHIELVNTDTGEDVSFILPKKVVFKIGHMYTCYFDNQIGNRPLSINNPKIGFINADMNLPTNGFLGFENFGIYQEKPVMAASVVSDTNTATTTTATTMPFEGASILPITPTSSSFVAMSNEISGKTEGNNGLAGSGEFESEAGFDAKTDIVSVVDITDSTNSTEIETITITVNNAENKNEGAEI